MPLFAHVGILCRMVKIEHSVFALPFAFMGAFAAARGWPGLTDLLLLTIAMVCVRSFAMAFNRIVDVRYDRLNPRTADRPLVTGEITAFQAWSFCGVMALGFIFAAFRMNDLCLTLSPLALAVASLYSFTKRFTWLCHFVLGLVLAMAPMAGWLAVEPEFSPGPVLLALAVLFWVGGFDIFYACQDLDFDARYKLHSVPVRFGIPSALIIAAFCHVNTVLFLVLAGWVLAFSWPWHLVCAAVAGLLYWEHRLIRPDDLSRLNMAFFALNGIVSVVLFGGVLAAVLVK